MHALLDALVAHEDGTLPDPRAIGAVPALDDQLARLPRTDAIAMRALLVGMEWGTLPFGGRRFSGMDVGARRAMLDAWSRSRWLGLRTAFTALKSLGMLAYWTRPETWPAIGYDGPWLGRVPVEVMPVPRP